MGNHKLFLLTSLVFMAGCQAGQNIDGPSAEKADGNSCSTGQMAAVVDAAEADCVDSSGNVLGGCLDDLDVETTTSCAVCLDEVDTAASNDEEISLDELAARCGPAPVASDVAAVCLASFVDSIPSAEASGFFDEECLVYNNPAFEDASLLALDNGDKVTQGGGFTQIRIESINDPLRIAMLVETLQYFSFDSSIDFTQMTLEELDAAGENAFWLETVHQSTGEAFTMVNIAAGDNPLEIAFRQGTLEPVAVTQDGSLTFCSSEYLGGMVEPAPVQCCKVCGVNSQACGDSCIALDKTCRKKDTGCACEG